MIPKEPLASQGCNVTFRTGHAVGLCREPGVGQLGAAGAAQAAPLVWKLTSIVRRQRAKECFPWQSFTFLSFYWKLIGLVISITCVCLFVFLERFFPNFHFYQEQLLD